MPTRPILYYITDSGSFAGSRTARLKLLLDKILEAVRCGVDFIQLREKALSIPELESLASEVFNIVRTGSPAVEHLKTRLLINSRTDVAISCGADGVHLRSDDVSPEDVNQIWRQRRQFLNGTGINPVISVSCHSAVEVTRAAREGATHALFGPVFEKHDAPALASAGLDQLRQACDENIPVLALGGITPENARACLKAGAAGIAGIRLFQENNIENVVRKLRG